jgi:SAM-dependent methyltransferase
MRERRVAPEEMDRPDVAPVELRRSLDDLRGVNRWLGGNRAVLRRLGPLLLRLGADGPVRVLDVGTGSADLPLLLVRWARARDVRLQVTAVDFHPETVRVAAGAVAQEPWVRIVRADALELPFADNTVHIAMCSTALHHFPDPQAERVLREMRRVASRVVFVSDLLRSGPALVGARALAATVWRGHPITRHDGPRSVAASFTVAELRTLAAGAGLAGARVRREPIFRLSLLHQEPGPRR